MRLIIANPELTWHRIRAWGFAVLVAICISSTQGIAFYVSYFFRQRDLLGDIVSILGLCLGLWLFERFCAARPSRGFPIFAFAMGVLGMSYVVFTAQNPSESFHAVGIFLLTFLIWRALSLDFGTLRLPILCFAITSTYGLIDEVVQYYHPLRYFDFMDVLLNISLSLFSTLILIGLQKQ